MVIQETELKHRIVKQAINSVRSNHKIDEISLLAVSKELNIEFSELTKYFNSMEDIFLELQKKDWRLTFKFLDKKIKKAKTPGDYKSLFDDFLADFVANLSSDADLHW